MWRLLHNILLVQFKASDDTFWKLPCSLFSVYCRRSIKLKQISWFRVSWGLAFDVQATWAKTWAEVEPWKLWTARLLAISGRNTPRFISFNYRERRNVLSYSVNYVTYDEMSYEYFRNYLPLRFCPNSVETWPNVFLPFYIIIAILLMLFYKQILGKLYVS